MLNFVKFLVWDKIYTNLCTYGAVLYGFCTYRNCSIYRFHESTNSCFSAELLMISRSFYESLRYLCTYIQVNVPNFLILPKFQNLTKIVQHQTTDLIVWLIQSHPKPKCSTFDQKKNRTFNWMYVHKYLSDS